MVFALMAGFVIVTTMSALRSPMNPLLGVSTTTTTSQAIPAGTGGSPQQAGGPADRGPGIQPASPWLNALLATALRTALKTHPGLLAVGVIDETTGQQALYAPTRHFSSGDIVTADILAALLVRQQSASAPAASGMGVLATAMMQHGNGPAAANLWRAIGEGNGLVSANRLLKLTQTIPGAGDQWNQTTTTVADQLQLLIDLTSSRSPLTAAHQHYMLQLMGGRSTHLPWGVPPIGAVKAVQDGWLAHGSAWLTNSIGIVARAHHELIVAVLSSVSTSRAAGLSLASAAALAAADVMTTPGS